MKMYIYVMHEKQQCIHVGSHKLKWPKDIHTNVCICGCWCVCMCMPLCVFGHVCVTCLCLCVCLCLCLDVLFLNLLIKTVMLFYPQKCM